MGLCLQIARKDGDGMTDPKYMFTDEEVIKGLECCAKNYQACEECPYQNNCSFQLEADALALINRQKAEITRLITSNSLLEARVCEDRAEIESLNAVHADMTESLRLAAEANKDMQVEIEGLKAENKLLIENDVRNKYPNCVSAEKGRIYTRTLEDYDELIGDISAEAIKEFAERLKADIVETGDEHGLGNSYPVLTHNYIDSLVKEMTEENK